MSKVVNTGITKDNRVMYLNKIAHIDVRLTEIVEGFHKEKYTVFINMLGNMPFQYNPEARKFYMDIEDFEAMMKKNDELVELTKDKSKEECKEIIANEMCEYVKRQEVVIFYDDDNKKLEDLVDKYVKYI